MTTLRLTPELPTTELQSPPSKKRIELCDPDVQTFAAVRSAADRKRSGELPVSRCARRLEMT